MTDKILEDALSRLHDRSAPPLREISLASSGGHTKVWSDDWRDEPAEPVGIPYDTQQGGAACRVSHNENSSGAAFLFAVLFFVAVPVLIALAASGAL